ncbi:alpha/beta hydrolase [Amycolatopsis regifaucium]|uniref:Acyl-CoA:diacylglycerol acyltransferase n=1 Tax=Amycolatopsis regifaucium TaxID=546365 RepID=A0A154MJW7_9PSEU|nr:alpha/beta hydrolase-fold protein [Amycolatopsis regifaucium]KZB84688.1 esterase [Amycolatopsis regifaucium]OKA11153.1 esterase [Amycolatopsis regifaucium]
MRRAAADGGGHVVSRRGLLLGAAALGGAALLSGCDAEKRPLVGPPPVAPPHSPAPLTEAVTVQRMRSAARNREVNLVIIAPDSASRVGLPVCVALHGRGADARTFLDLGVQDALNKVVAAGLPGFAVAAVDGDNYWVDVGKGDDPQRMLSEELPGWLAQRQLRPPSAMFGISMGGFGALRYAREHKDLKAVAVAGAALFVSWPDAKSRKVFADRAQWESHEPLLHTDELNGDATGVWCGNSDPFAGADRKLIKALDPAVGKMTPGEHNDDFWRGVMPEAFKFVGERIT